MNTKYKIKTVMRDGNSIAIIPPITAEKIFKDRLGNRPIHQPTVKLYAKAMEDGKWKPSSQISFCNGRLDDGQHRMMASILSGCSFECTMYFHDDPNTFSVHDIGKKRTNGDVLSRIGKKYANSLSACLQLLERINSKNGLPKGIGGNTRVIVPTYEIEDVLEKYPGIEYSVAQVHNNQKYLKIPPASTAALHYLIRKKLKEEDQSKVDTFVVDRLFKGLELKEDDPVFAFRKHLLYLKRICDKGAQAITHHTMFFGGLATWNKWIKNKKSKIFRVPKDTGRYCKDHDEWVLNIKTP
ncbi:hypothetical protein [uncultured Limnobacter sp.]|uniref:hypothetical protein n=1 Tax=uncultured Limnobacter sp. TaxID=199681 RepID=UPI0032B20224|tara:strand:- start:19 stop:909 length:891 start_codon:yes stop_codon:yes gene_type:complete